MTKNEKSSRAAIGLRVKTGRAVAVILAGPRSSPRVVSRSNLLLWDRAIPESFQPYHAEMELAPDEAAKVVPRALEAVKRVSLDALRALVVEVRAGGLSVRGIGLVMGSDAKPDAIKNPHIRAHAMEGRLFPDMLAAAAKTLGIPAVTIVERESFAKVAALL